MKGALHDQLLFYVNPSRRKSFSAVLITYNYRNMRKFYIKLALEDFAVKVLADSLTANVLDVAGDSRRWLTNRVLQTGQESVEV